jgi:periplasmic divalent cation tolerance protein
MTTVADAGAGESLARLIVEAKLAACVHILPKMTSVFFWEEKIQTETEHLLLIKTLEEKFDELSEVIRKNHSYDVPEIVAIEADTVSEDYLKWMFDVTSQNRER